MATSVTYEEYRGVKGLVCALLQTDDASSLGYGDIFPIAGVAEISKETDSSTDTKYYDNIPAIVIDAEGEDTVTITCSKPTEETLAKIMGQFYNTKSGVVVEGNASRPYCAIGYITSDTSGNDYYVWRYKGKFSFPTEDTKTKDNSTDSNGMELVFTGINTIHKDTSTKDTFKAVKYCPNTDTSTTKYTETTFFEEVLLPTDILTRS